MAVMLVVLLCVGGWSLASSGAVQKPFYDLEAAEQLFEDFIATHGKSYPHAVEKQRRFNIFKDNVARINRFNLESDAVHAINKFADLTPDEFLATYTGFKSSGGLTDNTCSVIRDADITTNDAPASWDWREHGVVAEVKDQGRCGSCWAFSCIGNIEGQYASKNKQIISLSEQQLVDCLGTGSCDGGDMVSTMSALKSVAGVELEADYPYAGKDEECKYDKSKVQVKITDCHTFDLSNEDQLKEVLYKYGPLSIGVAANAQWTTYAGSIYSVKDCPAGHLNHGVVLVGYGTEGKTDYWIIKNSWGADWGQSGYIKITRGENTCGLLNKDVNTAMIG